MKTKYYIFAYNQAGFDYIKLWKELDETEVEDLENEHGCLEEAALADAEGDLFWIVSENDLHRMRTEISSVLADK